MFNNSQNSVMYILRTSYVLTDIMTTPSKKLVLQFYIELKT